MINLVKTGTDGGSDFLVADAAFNSSDYDIDYTTAPSTQRYAWSLALSGVSAPPPVSVSKISRLGVYGGPEAYRSIPDKDGAIVGGYVIYNTYYRQLLSGGGW